MHIANLRFLYTTTLRRPEEVEALSWPTIPRRLPDIRSEGEIEALLGAIARSTAPCGRDDGARDRTSISEACSLLTTDIDSKGILIHVRDGKRARDRYVMLPQRLLALQREYWQQVTPSGTYLFPGTKDGRPIKSNSVRNALRMGITKAGIAKRVMF